MQNKAGTSSAKTIYSNAIKHIFSGLYNVTRATCHISLEQNTVFPQCFLAFKTTATPVKGKRETKHF